MADEHPGSLRLTSQASDFDATQSMIEQAISRISKVALVRVQKVSTNGAVAPVGKVGVVPLVKMQDAMGNVQPHGNINNLAYFRIQGGKGKAIIMDPVVGDIGVALFTDRDSSTVSKNNAGWDGTKSAEQTAGPPGSYRQHDMADGIFFGCVLGGKPTSYLRWKDDGSIDISPDDGATVVNVKQNEVNATLGSTVFQVTPTLIKGLVGAMLIQLTSSRVDLGGTGGTGVVTDAGVSSKVFAVL